MKKMNKILAVLLSVAMLCAMVPAFTATVSAAGVGEIENGGFENDTTGWTVNGVSIEKTHKNSGNASLLMPINDNTQGKLVAEQIVPVNRNGVYTLSFWIGVNIGNGVFEYDVYAGTDRNNCTQKLVERQRVDYKGVFLGSVRWEENTKENISVGQNTYIAIRFYAPSSGTRTHYLDDVTLTATTVGDPTHVAPTIESFGTRLNTPSSSAANYVKGADFESTTGAQWNTDTFIGKEGVSLLNDASVARSGSHCLQYTHNENAYTEWPEFSVQVGEAGIYVFSAWVRTPNLSENNQGTASIGIVNPEDNKFLTYSYKKNGQEQYYGHYSTPEIQIRSTATDDKWHLRSITFKTPSDNATIRIAMYGLSSVMYVDDISIHKEGDGVEYKGDQHQVLSSSTSVPNEYCLSENNLIADGSMNSEESREFWTYAASGWNNGFLEFTDSQDAEHGNALHFVGTNPASNKAYNYIKWIYVEPNTSYTVSFDYRVVRTKDSGTPFSQLMFIDNNIRRPDDFCTPDLGTATNTWKTFSFTFETADYNRIGIVLQDGNSEAYFDDFRFFKNDDGISEEPEEDIVLKNTYHGASRMEMGDDDKLGLAFLFKLNATGVTVGSDYVGDYSNGEVQPYGVYNSKYKLVAAGAMITNDLTVGQDPALFIRENRNAAKTIIDVPATYLFDDEYKSMAGVGDANSIVYGVRITNIPERHKFTDIFARPYYVFEDKDGNQITIYGDIQFDSYEAKNDINDGWMEWD